MCVLGIYIIHIYSYFIQKNKTKTVFYFDYESVTATSSTEYTKIADSGSATLPYQ